VGRSVVGKSVLGVPRVKCMLVFLHSLSSTGITTRGTLRPSASEQEQSGAGQVRDLAEEDDDEDGALLPVFCHLAGTRASLAIGRPVVFLAGGMLLDLTGAVRYEVAMAV